MKSNLHELHQSCLYKLSSRKKLISILGNQITYKDLDFICNNQYLYYENFKLIQTKDNGTIKKRKINKPLSDLKSIQKKLSIYLSKIIAPSYLKSKKGSSYKDNALSHLGNDYIFTLDIKDFFPNCSTERIAKSLSHHFKIAGDISLVLAKLMTLNGYIPQGCSTSTQIAFWSNFSMFEEISEYCKQFELTFTLFVDDITISSKQRISLKHYDHIVGIVKKNGFNIKHTKTQYYKKGQAKLVTGVVIASDSKHIESLYAKKKIFFKKISENKLSEKELQQLIGRFESLKYLEPNFCPILGKNIRKKISNLSKAQKTNIYLGPDLAQTFSEDDLSN